MTDRSFKGVPVNCCFAGSAAERAGIRPGDRIIAANGVQIDSLDAYVEARNVYNDRLELVLQRHLEIVEVVLHFRANGGQGTS